MSPNEKKGTQRKANSSKKVVRRSPSCRTGDDGIDLYMNNVNSTAVHKYTSFNFNFKLSSYLKEPSYTEWWWSDKSADEL